MPTRREKRIPKYRLHKPTGQAVVRLEGRDHYLGRHNTIPSREKYDRLIAEWLTQRRRTPTVPRVAVAPRPDLTVNELLVAFLAHAQEHYRDPDGNATNEVDNLKAAVRPLKQLYGHTPVAEFGPLALRAVQQDLVRQGLSRTTANARFNRIKRVFRWGVSVELVPAEVYQAVQTVPALRRGRTRAPEPEPVGPVAAEVVERTLPHLPPPVAAMARLQLLTGMRPGEVLMMRGCDIDRTGSVWTYRPYRHKNLHRGHARVIHLGPKAQEVLRPYLEATDPQAWLFSPQAWVEQRQAARAAQRKTPRTPSELRRKRKASPQRKPAARYNRVSYNQAIRRACAKAGVSPAWTPLQLRHTRATELRARYGVETTRTILGHTRVETSQIYAERDMNRAAEVMGQVG
jgi:integrase